MPSGSQHYGIACLESGQLAGLGLSGSEAEEYAKSVVFADLQEPGDDDIIAKVEQDLRAKSIIMTRAQLRKKLDEFAKQVRVQRQ